MSFVFGELFTRPLNKDDYYHDEMGSALGINKEETDIV